MKADLTRDSFDPARNFSRVLMQQGRVQLDADWNEQGDILLNLVRHLAADIGGQAWTPDGGFVPTQWVGNDVILPPGCIYVDGIRCQIEATPVPILKWDQAKGTIIVSRWTVDDTAFADGQYLQLSDDSGQVADTAIAKITGANYDNMQLTIDNFPPALTNAAAGRARRAASYLNQPYWQPAALTAPQQLYLDVWERLITCLEDDEIREVALNGVDTAARTKIIWQVKACDPLPAPNNAFQCMSPTQLKLQFQGWFRGLLRARVQPAAASTDPCTAAPDSAYRGPENQLYRVEIHTAGPAAKSPSFKWSRENGSAVYRGIAAAIAGTGTVTIPLGDLGRDSRFGLSEGNWVELQDDTTVLLNTPTPAPLLQVQSIDRTAMQVTLKGSAPAKFGEDPTLHPLLRRWDQSQGDSAADSLNPDGTLPIPNQAGVWIDLEDGVQVKFEWFADPDQATYRPGDYWLIPARVATGNLIWPTETAADGTINPVAKPPDGIDHHYAPLAVVTPPGPVKSADISPCLSPRTVRLIEFQQLAVLNNPEAPP